MKVAYFDCFSGISGDMILGALIDLGLKEEDLKAELNKLKLAGYQLRAESAIRGCIQGTKVEVITLENEQPRRNLAHINRIIEQSLLEASIKRKACLIFQRLAEVEAKLHGVSTKEVHFHELGAVDTIVDVVGALTGLSLLGIESIVASPVNVGSGKIDTQHGQLPVPAPATLELLKGARIYSSGADFELTTPTGAAIITHLAEEYGPYPAMRMTAVGYGAGSYNNDNFPNALRIVVGEQQPDCLRDQITVLETDIDDMNPQWYDWVMERAFGLGAVDVTIIPIYMKQNRPANRIAILSPPHLADPLVELLLTETTSLGVRIRTEHRAKLERLIKEVPTEFGPIKIKIAKINGEVKNIAPEYKDCQRIARETGRPLKEVYRAAIVASTAISTITAINS
jgi:uncharacterized protein (TIGR00299 family) protein